MALDYNTLNSINAHLQGNWAQPFPGKTSATPTRQQSDFQKTKPEDSLRFNETTAVAINNNFCPQSNVSARMQGITVIRNIPITNQRSHVKTANKKRYSTSIEEDLHDNFLKQREIKQTLYKSTADEVRKRSHKAQKLIQLISFQG